MSKVAVHIDETTLHHLHSKYSKWEVKKVLHSASRMLERDFNREVERVTEGWSSSPEFSAEVRGDSFWFTTDDERYTFVDRGTKAHIIRAKNARALRWLEGGKNLFARWIRHPGTTAQHLTEKILSKISPRAAAYIEEASIHLLNE